MKKISVIALALVAVLLVLCGCVSPPYAEQTFPSHSANSNNPNISNGGSPPEPTRKLYVSGAVEKDWFVDVPIVCDYKTVLSVAVALPCAASPPNVNLLVNSQMQSYVVDYVLNGVTYPSINVNGSFVVNGIHIDGVDDGVVDKLSQYLSVNGIITNRTRLRDALGEDYADNYYKFFIDIADYA